MPTLRESAPAAAMAMLAALLWATYYPFVLLATPETAPSALLVYPFLISGAIFAVVAYRRGEGPAFCRLWREPSAYGRVLLMAGMQVSVLASTYLTGPVDTSLLSLIGDVALTPLLLVVLFGEGRGRLSGAAFPLGLGLTGVGAGLTIVGQGGWTPLAGWDWLVAPMVPVMVALYFIATARANQRRPTMALLAQVSIGGGLVALLIAPAVPGGVAGLELKGALPLLAVVVVSVTSFYVAPVLYFGAIARVGMMLPALLMAAIPLFTLAFALSLLGLVPSWATIAGIPVAVVGALLATRALSGPAPTT